MTKLTTQNDSNLPKLHVAATGFKIKDFKPEERLGIAFKIVQTLLVDLAVGEKANTEHHKGVVKFIADVMNNYTIDEYRIAFDLFISGEFRDKPLQQLNKIVVGNVMSSYTEYKNEKLKIFNLNLSARKNMEPELSEEDKNKKLEDGVERLLNEFKDTNDISGNVSHIYSYLFKKGCLPRHNKAYKDKIKSMAKKVCKSNEMTKALKSNEARRVVKSVLDKIESGSHASVDIMAKKLILIDYFKLKIKQDE